MERNLNRLTLNILLNGKTSAQVRMKTSDGKAKVEEAQSGNGNKTKSIADNSLQQL